MSNAAKTGSNGTHELASLLRWYLEAGADEAVGEVPVDRTVPAVTSPPGRSGSPRPAASPSPSRSSPRSEPAWSPPVVAMPADGGSGPPTAPVSRTAAATDAAERARSAGNLEELRAALEGFEGCVLKKTAMNLCFGRGSPHARVVLIGEAPGQEEDRQGRPFVGASGRLLDRMLASIGLDESTVFISNTVFWRPPGNREPTDSETQACLPFVCRIIELIRPEAILTLGGPAAKTLLDQTGALARLRGRWLEFRSPGLDAPVPALATYHPAYLLRSPAQKRLVWRDLLILKDRLAG